MSGGTDEARLAAARQALAAAESAARASGLPRRGGPGPAGEVQGGDATHAGTRPARRSGVAGGGSSESAGGEPDPHAVARSIVLRQLAMGPRTRRQLEDKLRDRGCEPQVARAVLDRMTEVGLVDDESYAEMFVRSRQETKGLAASALRHELRQKGVADDVVEAALEEVDPEREKEQARALVARRLRTMRGLDREVQTRRLAGFLARKGYGSSVSHQVIREALDELPEHLRD
ncbi:recombination regulator RecX [Ornithinimicrobium humiphilum]|uniref:Regulatory protein RecX n=1 Tax=Ornithinimicrobium humiphilum TaxID=125288 RepID=A0A543KQP9_9MICO|nr:regulatory protein RecX [Ornithinimicrobium humiphilum]TQM97374.1 regulatory protein [Ornithinimicrobium humiphilum]